MSIGFNNINFNKIDLQKKNDTSSAHSVSDKSEATQTQEKSKVNASLAAAVFGIKTSPNFGGKKQNPQINDSQNVNNLPFADKLKPADKRNLAAVLKKDDEEADYMKKLIGFVSQGKAPVSTTQTLCKHGVMSELVKKDIDIYTEKVENQSMSEKDAFVPEHSSVKNAEKEVEVGDVYRVKGQDKIYVKIGDKSSTQLEMDADMYLKLFPPIERFAACQNSNGDCFFLSSVNSIMENPTTKSNLV